MGLVVCIDCGKEISDRIQSCPHCGCPVNISLENSKKLALENVVNTVQLITDSKQVKSEQENNTSIRIQPSQVQTTSTQKKDVYVLKPNSTTNNEKTNVSSSKNTSNAIKTTVTSTPNISNNNRTSVNSSENMRENVNPNVNVKRVQTDNASGKANEFRKIIVILLRFFAGCILGLMILIAMLSGQVISSLCWILALYCFLGIYKFIPKMKLIKGIYYVIVGIILVFVGLFTFNVSNPESLNGENTAITNEVAGNENEKMENIKEETIVDTQAENDSEEIDSEYEVIPFEELCIARKDINTKIVCCSVKVDDVGVHSFNSDSMPDYEHRMSTTTCTFKMKNEKDIESIQEGDYITIKGEVLVEKDFDFELVNCEIVAYGEQAKISYDSEMQDFYTWLDSNIPGGSVDTIDSFEIDLESNSEYEQVLATDLIALWVKNPSQAKKYENTNVEIKGRVSEKTASSSFTIRGSEREEQNLISCIPKSDRDKELVKQLQVGDNIIVRGKVVSVGSIMGIDINIDEMYTENLSAKKTIVIKDNVLGEYGQSDFFDGNVHVRYYVPAGKYTAKCVGSTKGTGFY